MKRKFTALTPRSLALIGILDETYDFYMSISEQWIDFISDWEEMCITQAKKQKRFDRFCEYYLNKGTLATVYKGNIIKNLIMDCQSYTKYRPNETKVFYFEVNDHSDALKECLNRMPPKASKEELNALKAVYNAYLSEQHSELFETVQDFKDSYLDIRSYLQKGESDDALRQKVEGELKQYVCDIFEDINKLESIPYTYSKYTSDHSSGAFITESTKRAHDQIWIALNEPFRLLKLNVFVKGFHVDRLLEGASEESKQDTLAVLRTLYHHIDLELGKLSDSFCELPLMKSLSAEPTDEFFDCYAKEVLPVFKDAALNTEKLMDRIHTLQKGGDDIAAFSPAASVLRANAQIVAAHLIHKCAAEIMDQYSALESVLAKYEKDRKGSGESS